MRALFLTAFISGLLLAVRLMFFGAERRHWLTRHSEASPLRRSEPAGVAFLIMFGIAGYLVVRYSVLSAVIAVSIAAGIGVVWAILVTRVAIVMARVVPNHEVEDPASAVQGRIGIVTVSVDPGDEGAVAYETGHGRITVPARAVDGQAIEAGTEVCIERMDNGVAFVERWAVVEARL